MGRRGVGTTEVGFVQRGGWGGRRSGGFVGSAKAVGCLFATHWMKKDLHAGID